MPLPILIEWHVVKLNGKNEMLTVDGIRVIINSDEAKLWKQKYPNCDVKPLRKGRSQTQAKHKHGVVRSIPVQEYLNAIQ